MRNSRHPNLIVFRRAGFTLVELSMVVATIAVVGAIVVPRFTSATVRYQLDSAAHRVALDLESARQEAITSSSSRTVRFNSAALSYTISRLDESSNVVAVRTVELHLPPYHITQLTAAVNGDANVPVIFNGYGQVNGAGVVQLRIGGGTSRSIHLDAQTGKAQVQ